MSPPQPRARRARLRQLFARVGPEVLTAASDNDPTNVGTATLVGAQTGYQLSWVALMVAPLLGVVLAIAAQVGVVARSDLQSLVREHYSQRTARVLLLSVVVVNLVTIAADLRAGAAGIGVLAGIGSSWFVVPLGLALVGLLFIGKYDEVVSLLRYALIGFLAFGAAAVLAQPDWSRVLKSSLVPTLSLQPAVLTGAIALIGTTLTSYVYIWETISRGVEEPVDGGGVARGLARSKIGAIAGAVSTALILWFMLITSAATLGRHHEPVVTALDASQVLRPIAGTLAADFFAVGLIASAVVALPVLMASTAYVIGAEFDWRRGLSEGIIPAWEFYSVLAASIGLAIVVDLARVPLLGMLVAASVIGGVATPLGIILLIRLARDRRVMGDQPISDRLAMAGWAVAVIIGFFSLLYVGWGFIGKFLSH